MDKSITPSLICMDHCNLERDLRLLEQTDCPMLHVDILDGYFSPSMPIGIDTVRQLRKKTALYFDAHIMTMDNTFYAEELMDIGVGRLCFQTETERHISRKLDWIRSKGVEAGVALAPATPISTLECCIEQCDFVLLMMINPGFASAQSEAPKAFLKHKIVELREMIERKNLSTNITIDGRTFLKVIPDYIAAGADTFVAGTSCLFRKNGLSLQENYETLRTLIQNTKGKRHDC